jgi:hypothetical protein
MYRLVKDILIIPGSIERSLKVEAIHIFIPALDIDR